MLELARRPAPRAGSARRRPRPRRGARPAASRRLAARARCPARGRRSTCRRRRAGGPGGSARRLRWEWPSVRRPPASPGAGVPTPFGSNWAAAVGALVGSVVSVSVVSVVGGLGLGRLGLGRLGLGGVRRRGRLGRRLRVVVDLLPPRTAGSIRLARCVDAVAERRPARPSRRPSSSSVSTVARGVCHGRSPPRRTLLVGRRPGRRPAGPRGQRPCRRESGRPRRRRRSRRWARSRQAAPKKAHIWALVVIGRSKAGRLVATAGLRP